MVSSPQPKRRGERAFRLGGAGAPAHAYCRKEPIFNFHSSLSQGDAVFHRTWRRRGGMKNSLEIPTTSEVQELHVSSEALSL